MEVIERRAVFLISDGREEHETTVLREVRIKREGGVKLGALHQCRGGTVGITEAFVRVTSEKGALSHLILGRNADKARDLLLPQSITETDCRRMAEMPLRKCHHLIENVCTRHKGDSRLLDKAHSGRMVQVLPVEERISSTGVHKDEGRGHRLLGPRVEELVVAHRNVDLLGLTSPDKVCKCSPLRGGHLGGLIGQEQQVHALVLSQI